MKQSKPPGLATWLLEHLGWRSGSGALAGDLIEEFNGGRSAAWYWGQVLVAIIAGCAGEVRRHPVLAARAILITWAANYGAVMLAVELFRHRLVEYHPQIAQWAICFLGGLTSGLIVALLHRGQRTAMILTSAIALLCWAVIAIVLFKPGALQHSVLQIAAAALVYYLVTLTGFGIGGALCARGQPSPA